MTFDLLCCMQDTDMTCEGIVRIHDLSVPCHHDLNASDIVTIPEMKTVGVYCEDRDGDRFPCPEKCWSAFTADPGGNPSNWGPVCRVDGKIGTPHLDLMDTLDDGEEGIENRK